MLTRLTFRLVVLVVLALQCWGAARGITRPGLTPSQVADYEGEFRPDQYEGRHALRVALISTAMVLAVIGAAAMIRFARHARGLYLLGFVAVFMVVELLRPYVHPGAGEGAFELSIVLMTLVLATIYFSPARRWLRGRNEGSDPSLVVCL